MRENHVGGYTRVGLEEGDETYGAGFSIYSAAWPLLQEYPGHKFQSGLFGNWMYSQSDDPELEGVWFYSTIEGGLGWWRDTRFPTETPKFIMGAVALGFCAWANGPGAGKGRDWDAPKGHYGIAQLSPCLLWPPDGVNMKQGTCGELLGYGYLPLPLTNAKETTAGAPVPTGDQCWTLFLNSLSFKGPATFVLPYFFSGPSVDEPRVGGLFLDSRPSEQNRTHSMETQYIPWAQATDGRGRTYARMAPTLFPAGQDDESAVLHQVTSYNRKALWDRAKAWMEGGDAADSVIDQEGAYVHEFTGKGGVQWAVFEPDVPREERVQLASDQSVRLALPDATTLRMSPESDLVRRADSSDGALMMLPEYYQLVEDSDGKRSWVAVTAEGVPPELGLDKVNFGRPDEPEPQPYVTPQDAESCWKKPGPVAGPFTAYPGDGSEVIYYWYRFADQPALLNADMSDAEREDMQKKVEKIHQHWTKDREYLAPPSVGTLAGIDPALVVTPPDGLEVGYVPVVTRQEKS